MSQSNIYMTPALIGGYMITNNVELRLSLGGQLIQQSVGDTTSFTNTGFVGALQALYQKDLILGMAIYAGLGGGGFLGTRTAEAGGAAGLEERRRTTPRASFPTRASSRPRSSSTSRSASASAPAARRLTPSAPCLV